MPNELQAGGGRYWLLIDEVPNGPFDVTQIHAKLLSGTIAWQTQACPVGGSTWLPLMSVPVLGPSKAPPSEAILTALPVEKPLDVIPVAFPVESTPRSSALPFRTPVTTEEGTRQKSSSSWNPVVITWLGLIFSPVWAGIMAVLNSRRLGLSLPIWRPIWVGVGALLLDLVSGAVFDTYWVDVLLYLGALGLIWLFDLRPQAKAYTLHVEQERKAAAGWLVPILAGAPAALLVFLAFVVAPLIPLEPRQVCEKFAAAKTEKEMKKYTTINLWPVLAVLAQQQDTEDADAFELTEEGPAPDEVGGYLVGFRGDIQGRQGTQSGRGRLPSGELAGGVENRGHVLHSLQQATAGELGLPGQELSADGGVFSQQDTCDDSPGQTAVIIATQVEATDATALWCERLLAVTWAW